MNLQLNQIVQVLLRELYHSRRAVVWVFITINILALVAGLAWPKGYMSSTSIVVDERNIIQPLMQGAAVATEVRDRARLAREIIHGRRVMNEILEQVGWLKNNPSDEDKERIVESIRKRTSVYTVGQNIIRIEHRDDNPTRAYKTAVKLADLFIAESLNNKSAESRAAYEFIDKQTNEYHAKLTEAEQMLKELRGENLDARIGTDNDLNTRLGTLQTRVEQSTMELREAEIRKASLEKQLSGEIEVVTVLSRENQYRTRIAELQSQLDVLRLNYHETYPDIVRIRHQINDLNENIKQDSRRRETAKAEGRVTIDESVVNNPMYQQLRRELSQTQIQIDTLLARIASAQKQLRGEVARGKRVHGSETRLAQISRDYQVNRDIYQDLLRRRENARVSMNLDVEKQGLSFRIQEPALLPLQPSGMRFGHFLLIGLLIGLVTPVALLYMRLQFDPRLRLATLLSTYHKEALVAKIPHMWRASEIAAAHDMSARLMLALGGSILVIGVAVFLKLLKIL